MGALVVFSAAVTVAVIFPRNAGLAGLAITSALNLTGIMNWMVRQTTELEVNMNSVERMVEYNRWAGTGGGREAGSGRGGGREGGQGRRNTLPMTWQFRAVWYTAIHSTTALLSYTQVRRGGGRHLGGQPAPSELAGGRSHQRQGRAGEGRARAGACAP
jgi:hypothetical protein